MKNTALFVFALLISTFSFAQNTKYTEAMQSAITSMEEEDKLQAATNMFERIAGAATSEWLPQYYLAQCNLNLGWMASKNDDWKGFDAHIEKAYTALEAAEKIVGKKNAELLTLEAYVYQARIMRNPMINGPRFAGTIDGLLEKAQQLEPNNPRAYYLQGQQTFNMPSFLGGGAENALPLFETAAKKFAAFTPTSALHPNWGEGMNTRMLGIAKERVKG